MTRVRANVTEFSPPSGSRHPASGAFSTAGIVPPRAVPSSSPGMEPLPCESSTVPPSSGPRPRPVRPPRRRRARRTCGRPTSRGRGGPRAGPPPAPWRRWCAHSPSRTSATARRGSWTTGGCSRSETCTAWSTLPDRLRTRPGAWAALTFSHGVVGPHLLVHFLLLTVLNVGVAMVIFFALCPWVRRHLAFAVACVWVEPHVVELLALDPARPPGADWPLRRHRRALGGPVEARRRRLHRRRALLRARPRPGRRRGRGVRSPPPRPAGRPSRRSGVASWPWPGGCWRTPPIPRNASRAYLRTATSAASACCGRATSVRPPRGPRQPGGPGGRRPHRRDPGDRPLRP